MFFIRPVVAKPKASLTVFYAFTNDINDYRVLAMNTAVHIAVVVLGGQVQVLMTRFVCLLPIT